MNQKLEIAIHAVKSGILEVRDDGSIWRLATQFKNRRKSIVPRRIDRPTPKGYFGIAIHLPRENGRSPSRTVLAHVLVWTLANGAIPEGLQVNHKDSNKGNNKLENLEIVSQSENILHSYVNGRSRPWSKGASEWRPGRARLTPEQITSVLDMRDRGLTGAEIGRKIGVTRNRIYQIFKKGPVANVA